MAYSASGKEALRRGIKLLALDLDGTLLTTGKRLTKRTEQALKDAFAAGIEPVWVTGRPFHGIPREIFALPGARYAISSNGAVTTELATNAILRTRCIAPDTACGIVKLAMARKLVHSVIVDGYGYCEAGFYDKLLAHYEHNPPIYAYIRASRRPAPDIERTIHDAETGAENIWMVARDRDERDELKARICGAWPVQSYIMSERDVEFGHPQADKGLALAELAARLGIGRECILSLGDNENDLGMFSVSGISAAMGNGTAQAKAAADLTADPNDNDGAAKVIEWVLDGR